MVAAILYVRSLIAVLSRIAKLLAISGRSRTWYVDSVKVYVSREATHVIGGVHFHTPSALQGREGSPSQRGPSPDQESSCPDLQSSIIDCQFVLQP